VIGDTNGFSFSTAASLNAITMGNAIERSDLGMLFVSSPYRHVRCEVLRNGQIVDTENDVMEFSFKPDEPGAYRVEVYRDDLGPPFDRMPWIISNPIYVQ